MSENFLSQDARYMKAFVCKASEAKGSRELFALFMMFVDLGWISGRDGSYNDFILSVVDTYGDRDDLLKELEADRLTCEVITEGYHSEVKDTLVEILVR